MSESNKYIWTMCIDAESKAWYEYNGDTPIVELSFFSFEEEDPQYEESYLHLDYIDDHFGIAQRRVMCYYSNWFLFNDVILEN